MIHHLSLVVQKAGLCRKNSQTIDPLTHPGSEGYWAWAFGTFPKNHPFWWLWLSLINTDISSEPTSYCHCIHQNYDILKMFTIIIRRDQRRHPGLSRRRLLCCWWLRLESSGFWHLHHHHRHHEDFPHHHHHQNCLAHKKNHRHHHHHDGVQFNWHSLPEHERKRRTHSWEPAHSPTMAGGLFSIDKDVRWWWWWWLWWLWWWWWCKIIMTIVVVMINVGNPLTHGVYVW